MKKMPKLTPVLMLLVGTILIAGHANAGIISLDNLVNGDFEDPDITGEANVQIPGWSRAGDWRIADTNDLPDWGNTSGVASQVAMLFSNSASANPWMYQTLTGTTDANGSNHTLTATEGAGETVSVSFRIGIQSFSGWQNAHSLNTIGFQVHTDWTWMASRTYYTGTIAQATADSVTADVYLGLDDTNAAGDSIVVTHDFVLGASTSTYDLAFAINTTMGATGTDHARGIYDDVSVELVPEPATMSLLALGGIAMLKRRKK